MSQINFTARTAFSSGALTLGFVNVNPLTSDNISVFSKPGYAPTNSLGLATHIFNPGIPDLTTATVTVCTLAVSSLGSTTSSITGLELKVVNNMIHIETISEPILIERLTPGADGGIYPEVSNGIVWRLYKMPNTEPSWSWLTKAGYASGDYLLLGYTVPELKYQTYSSIGSGDQYYPNKPMMKSVSRSVYPLNPHTLQVPVDFKAITSIEASGATLFSGHFTDTSLPSGIIQSWNPSLKQIKLNQAVESNVKFTITGLTLAGNYTYTGHRHVSSGGVSTWRSFDANPEYGRVIYSQNSSGLEPTVKGLIEQVLLFAVPTCAAKISLTSTGSGEASGTIVFDSAFNYQETHFIRHIVGATTESFDPEYNTGDYEFYNYWGVTPFGQAQYNDIGSAYQTGDQYSSYLPSMLPIGRFNLDSIDPNTIVSITDLRERGGGLPDNFNFDEINTDFTLRNKYKKYWDLGVWDGVVKSEGGSIIVEISSDRLNYFTEQEIEKIVGFHVVPGVTFTINYV